jgi:F-type H+-transporting ATPase subunit epsilon
MAQAFAVNIVSPTATVFDSTATQVEVPGAEGDFGVLAHHAPFFSMLRPGVITVHLAVNQTKRFFVTSGYADVSGDRTTILSDHVQDLEFIDPAEAKAALEAALAAVATAEDDLAKARAHKRVIAAKALVAALHG